MCEAWQINRPSSSNRPTEQSRRSLMLVENDERIRLLPMSSVIERRRLLKTSMATGSKRRVAVVSDMMMLFLGGLPLARDRSGANHDIAGGVEFGGLAGQHQRGRAHLFDD